MGTLSSILAGLGKGLQQAGSMGLEYTFNSKLQGERLAAEEKRQLRITEIEQQGATVRMDKQIGAENLRGDRSLKQDEMQFGESMKRIESQLELARVGNDLTRQKLLIEEKNALTAELAAKSNARLDTIRGKALGVGADLKGKDIGRKELSDLIKSSSNTYKVVTKEIDDNIKNGINDPKKMQMLYDQQSRAIKTRDDATAALATVAAGGVNGDTETHVSGPISKHSDADQKLMTKAMYAESLANLNEHPEVYKDEKMYQKFRRLAIKGGASREEMDAMAEAYADGKATHLLKQYEDDTKQAGSRWEDGDSILTRAFKGLTGSK